MTTARSYPCHPCSGPHIISQTYSSSLLSHLWHIGSSSSTVSNTILLMSLSPFPHLAIWILTMSLFFLYAYSPLPKVNFFCFYIMWTFYIVTRYHVTPSYITRIILLFTRLLHLFTVDTLTFNLSAHVSSGTSAARSSKSCFSCSVKLQYFRK